MQPLMEAGWRITGWSISTDPVQITKFSMRSATPVFASCMNLPPFLRHVFPFLGMIALVSGVAGVDKTRAKDERKARIKFDCVSKIITAEMKILDVTGPGVMVDDDFTEEKNVPAHARIVK